LLTASGRRYDRAELEPYYASAEQVRTPLYIQKATGPLSVGERRPYFTSLAGKFQQQGLSVEAALAAVHQINLERCQPALDDAVLENYVRQAYGYWNAAHAKLANTHVELI